MRPLQNVPKEDMDCLMKQICITENHETIINFILKRGSLLEFSFLLLFPINFINQHSVIILDFI
jgi:hypothetical protein